jgi:hypothetical protein
MKRTIRVSITELINGEIREVEAYVCGQEAKDFFLVYVPILKSYVYRLRQAITPPDFDESYKNDSEKFGDEF